MREAGEVKWLTPQWPAPERVRAAFTLRSGGASVGAFASLNLATHVGDDPLAVRENRRRISQALALPSEPAWIEQVHGTSVCELPLGAACRADAALARASAQVAVIQVADCLPVLFAAQDGSAVAAAHAGWRGLAAGILEATVARLQIPPARLLAWLGPAIEVEHFEVGSEVRAAFLEHDAAAEVAFRANARGRWQCDLALLARQRLARLGLHAVYAASLATYAEAQRFFSYRRDGQCGRMAALIWLQ